jgi:hypothetical protein
MALRSIQDAITAPTGGVRYCATGDRGTPMAPDRPCRPGGGGRTGTWRWLATRSASEDLLWQSRPFVTTSAVEFGSRVSPKAEWLSFIATSGGTSRILVQRIDGGESRPLTLGPGEPISQVWSPDGNQIACILELDGGLVLQVYPAFFGGAAAQSIALDKTLQSPHLLRWIGRDIYFRTNVKNETGRQRAPRQPGPARRRRHREQRMEDRWQPAGRGCAAGWPRGGHSP